MEIPPSPFFFRLDYSISEKEMRGKSMSFPRRMTQKWPPRNKLPPFFAGKLAFPRASGEHRRKEKMERKRQPVRIRIRKKP